MEFETVIRGGQVATTDGTFKADVGIAEGLIAAVAPNLPEGSNEIDADGMLVAPGAIDVHTHFDHYVDYIGSTNADDYESGTRAAAVGGITTIINFAFQATGHTLREAIEHELDAASGKAHIDYGLHVVPTDLSVEGTLEALPELPDEGFASVKIFTTVANYRLLPEEILTVLRLCRDNGLLVSVHAEDDPLIQHRTDAFLSDGLSGVEQLPKARGPETEAIATARVASYAREIQAPVYFVHLSSKEALDEVRRSRALGGEVYVETRPVYLYLDDSVYQLPNREGNKYVCLPPIRSKENQVHLWNGLKNGEIQTYATDHAPWQSKQKLDPSRPFPKIPAGVSNVQTSIGMLYSEGVKREGMSIGRFVAVTSTNPAKLFGMWPNKGSMVPGTDADIVVIDPDRRVTISGSGMESQADYDPYEGYEGVGWPVLTVSRGQVIASGGEIQSTAGRGELLKRDPYQRL